MTDRLSLHDVDAARRHPNVQAALWAIRYGEGTQTDDGWKILFGGGRFSGDDKKPDTFDDYADHPRTVVHKNGYDSTAAGAFQIIEKTWDMVHGWYPDILTDFSPVNQERAAVFLIYYRKALADVMQGRVMDWVEKLNKEWASLPGSPYGQPVVSIEDVIREYRAVGGRFEDEAHIPIAPAPTTLPDPVPAVPDPVATPAPAPAPTSSPRRTQVGQNEDGSPIYDIPAVTEVGVDTSRSFTMAPFIAMVLPQLISLVPALAKIFGSGSEISNRNIAAAEMVVNVAKQAIDAKNEQELAERITTDKTAADLVKDAVEKNYFRLEEIGGGVAAARAFSLQLAGVNDPEHRTIPLMAQPAFIISIALILLVFTVVGVVLIPWEIWNGNQQIYSDELRLVVVTAILGALGTITAFWLGSSFGSQKKDQAVIGSATIR